MIYKTNDKIKKYLSETYLYKLKKASLIDLLNFWRLWVDKLDDGCCIDDYTNDLTVRDAIENIKEFIEEDEKAVFLKELEVIDNLYKSKTLEVENTYFKNDRWFYGRVPKYLAETEKLKIKK